MSNKAPSPTVLVAVCGGVAAYKAASVVSSLRQRGCEVQVAMTRSAQKFVTPLTFSAVSGNPVLTHLVPRDADSLEATYPHLYPATRANAFVVLPATANTLAKLAQGIADDIVCCSALSLPESSPRLLCPAMNVEMWEAPSVQRNLATLEAEGWTRIGPERGHLACGMQGAGRMTEAGSIVDAVLQALENRNRLAGKRVLILSGPTREHLDPVRYIGNPSSGKMGLALARAALENGAEVDFVSGPVPAEHLPRGRGLTLHRVTSATEMLGIAEPLATRSDIMVYAAAVADYAPETYHPDKLPKQNGELTLKLKSTPDIAATLNRTKQGGQVSIGFALQSGEGVTEAQAKLEKKNLDGIVLNHLDSLGADDGSFTLFLRNGREETRDWGRLDKRQCAGLIFDAACELLESKA